MCAAGDCDCHTKAFQLPDGSLRVDKLGVIQIVKTTGTIGGWGAQRDLLQLQANEDWHVDSDFKSPLYKVFDENLPIEPQAGTAFGSTFDLSIHPRGGLL